MVDWNEVIGELATQALRILLPVCIMLVLKWASEIWKNIKKDHPDLAKAISIAASIGYAAAEEFFRNQKDAGEEKLDYAVDRAEEYLLSLGCKVDLNTIKDAIIEYGVSNYKFSWVKPEWPMAGLIQNMKQEAIEGEPEADHVE